jgi:ribosomal protein S27AE
VNKFLWINEIIALTTTANNIICSRCGGEMNHHCDKLVYATDFQDMHLTDPALGGIIIEFHACPKCGTVASRHA